MTDPPYLESNPDGVLLTVWVVPGARRSAIVGPHGNALKVRVTAPPEAGAANRELLRLLERITDANATLVRGATSRRKAILIEGTSAADARAAITAAMR